MALVRRNYLYNPRARSKMADAGWDMGQVVSMSAKSTRGYGVPEPHRGMMTAAVFNTSVGGYVNAVRSSMERDKIDPGGTVPGGQWFSGKLTAVTEQEAIDSFYKTAATDLKELEKAGLMPEGGWTLIVDMYKICRYDRIRADGLFKSRYEKGTAYFERYMSVQCADDGAHLNLGALPVYREDKVPQKLKHLLAECRAQDIPVKLVLLDGEFFTVESIRSLDELDLGYLIPCSNRTGVVTAIRQFADGKHEAVSENKLSGSSGVVSYTLVVTERRRCKKKPKTDPLPEEKYIGFATNIPDIDVRVYGHRWVVETGYSRVEAMRPRTRNNGARLFCFLYALAIFNSGVMWNTLLRAASVMRGRYKPMTQNEMNLAILDSELACVLKPPPPPPSDIQSAVA